MNERVRRNGARYNLITKFYCTECGNQLALSYTDEGLAEATDHPLAGCDPTGATVRYNQIYVEPCAGCIEKHTEPARKIAEGFAALLETEKEMVK